MRLKRGLLAGIALCCMPLMTACSAKDTIGILVGNNSEDTKKEEVTVDLNAANIDDSVEKPQITSEMGDPVTYDLHATADALTVEATVSEGTLSYQWYRNNVDSNGGGTAIDGATEATYTPPTTESGTIYYYVVVTNTVGDGVQLTASGTKSVTITEQEAAPEEPEVLFLFHQSLVQNPPHLCPDPREMHPESLSAGVPLYIASPLHRHPRSSQNFRDRPPEAVLF